ncbi:MAG TPA: GNAT family N-acetyltransferase, partial [Thermotogota bacterium]|nr:GNAT family N-acetyltransferase [Thermotogota bacterium]
DGFFYAAIPLLEVLPEYRGKGIGTELIRRMRQFFEGFYGMDLICDENLAPFYEKRGFFRAVGMIWRNDGFGGGVQTPTD